MEENKEVKNEVVVATPVESSLTLQEELGRNSQEFYCSMKAETLDDKKAIFNAMGKCDFRLSDCLNKTINLKDVIAQRYTSVDAETGEVTEKIRTIFIDTEGVTYASASKGLFNSLKKVFALIGMPNTWAEPIALQVVETTTKQGFKTFEIKLV